jgi:tripartite-type tricarboxylate transporter receptor subunit TctC
MMATGAAAQSPADFYKGRTIKMIVGASVTGGYNAHARVVSRYMGKYIPGNPSIVVQNMPAGAGIAATNHVFNISEKDGSEMGLFNRYTVVAPLLGTEQAKYKSEQFNWLGTTAGYSDNAYVFVIRSELPLKTIDDMRTANPPLNVGNVGAAPIKVLGEALGLSLKIINGYQGDALDIAFERGEVDGNTVGYQTMLATKPHWVEKGYARVMIQFGRTERLPALKDVPTGRELARTPEDRQLLEFVEAPLLIGYPFAMPPGVPADRVAAMRKAFADAMKDPELQAEMKKSSLEYSPRTGEDIQNLIVALSKTPKSVIERYKAAAGEGAK